MCDIKYGGTLTPAEALRCDEQGHIPVALYRAIGNTKFPDRLADEVKQLENGTACEVIKAFLAAYGGRGRNSLAAACFGAKYKLLIDASPAASGIPQLWQRPELVFVAAYVVTVPNPPAHYLRVLAKAKPRRNRTKDEWEAQRASAHPS
jgi:hypothetical protein